LSNHPDGPFLFEIRLGEKSQDSRGDYDLLYSESSLSQIESFYLWLMKQMSLPDRGRLLDIACGAGEVVRHAGLKGLQAVGIDISEVVARSASTRVAGAGLIGVGMGESLPFADDCFDTITNIGSLEHFVDPAKGVREIARTLKTDGQAFILVPNTFSLLTNILVAFRQGRTVVDNQPIQRYGARHDWVQLLEENGLVVRKTIKYERPWPYHSADWGYYFRHPKDLLRLILSPFVPLNLAYSFLFVCEHPMKREKSDKTM
jgi:SAM-dependent methyltransferase